MEYQNNQTVFSSNCEKCGRTLYEGEMLNIAGRYVCEPCASSHIFGAAEPRRRRRVPSPFFHFIFSLHPGAGHMYLGLMKRGLFQMCLFYFCIFLTATSMPDFFGFTIPIIYIYSFFDSLVLRRRMADGEAVSDDLSGVASFVNRNKSLIVIAVVIMLAMSAFSALFGMAAYFSAGSATNVQEIVVELPNGATGVVQHTVESPETYARRHGSPIRAIAPIVLIGIGGIIVLKAVKGKRKKDESGIIDDFEIKN